MDTNRKIIPVILSGGSGTRLWPLSRASYPKQYLSLTQNTEKSMLQLTLERLKGLKNIEPPILICNEEHRFILAEQLRQIDIKPKSILLEPFGRNTAPAIAIAALKAIEHSEESILLVLPADHDIKNTQNFLEAIKSGCEYAVKNRLVTFGIVPTSAETGFGYIKSEKSLNAYEKGFPINKFIEKPSKEVAEKLIKDDSYTWNSGMFVFQAKIILNELCNFCPDLVETCKKSIEDNSIDLDFQRIEKSIFENCQNISIDNAVMERTNIGTVIPLDASWSDLGGWNSIWEANKKDINGNFKSGKAILSDSKDCYARSEERMIVGIGLKDLIIVETKDAILISDKKKSHSIKKILDDLNKKGCKEAIEHKKIHRPWGNYTSIEEGERWKVKKIEVKPKHSLSLQMHHHRAEHWIVVTGTAEVELDDKKIFLAENQSTYIPLGSKHRLSNPGSLNLILIEVQSGSYLGEDDIVRFKDYYGRK